MISHPDISHVKTSTIQIIVVVNWDKSLHLFILEDYTTEETECGYVLARKTTNTGTEVLDLT